MAGVVVAAAALADVAAVEEGLAEEEAEAKDRVATLEDTAVGANNAPGR